MSLQVWLPLNGDLHNQGCTDYTITAFEASPTFTTGKIGQCYQRANTSSQITNGLQIQDNLVSTFGTAASVAVWVKPLGTHTHYNGTILSSGDWNKKRWAFGVSQDNSQVDVLCGGYNNYISCTVPVNQWTHLASTFENGVCKLYKNGVYVGEKTGQAAFDSDANWTGICRETYAGGYFGFNGCINDLRIYDHCLSVAEVKEISQGLVLHYKLDDQFSENTTNLASTATSGWNNSGTCTRTTNDTTIPNPPTNSNTYSIRATSDGSMAAQIGTTSANHPSKTIIASTYVWLDGTQDSSSFYLRSVKTDGSVGALMYNGNSNPTTWPQRQWIRIATNAIATASDATKFYICTYVNKNTEVRAFNGWQIEEKDHVTPWTTPGTTRTSTNIQDSSGYGHNGSINGTLTLSSDTARYSACGYFGEHNTPNIIVNDTSTFAPALTNCTIAWWGKYDTTKTLLLTGQTTSYYIAASDNNTYYHGSVGSNTKTFYKDGVAGSYKCAADGWHFFAVTGLNLSTWTALKLNSYSSSWRLRGYINDLRIYCTALDADAIRQLYEVGAKMDNKQNLHTFEINESSSNMFRSELIMPWAKPNRTRIGEVVEHNGYMALNIAPEPFYNNISGTTSGALDGMFQAGSYVFDIWVDVDSVISGGTNRGGGMVIRYSDNTSENAFVFTGGNLGYQHKIYITPANKTVQRLEFYYYTSTDVFYRIDSCIYPINQTKIFKKGIVQSAGFLEDTKSRIIKNSLIETNEIIEL